MAACQPSNQPPQRTRRSRTHSFRISQISIAQCAVFSASHPPRVLSLAAFGRRPPVYVAPMSLAGIRNPQQTEKSDRPPSRSVLPPEPDIDAKQPAVACDARPVDEFNPTRGRGKGQSHPCRSLKLGPIGSCLIRASLFLFQRISHKRLVLMRFLRSLADEKTTGLQNQPIS